jgi:hypothetical protein
MNKNIFIIVIIFCVVYLFFSRQENLECDCNNVENCLECSNCGLCVDKENKIKCVPGTRSGPDQNIECNKWINKPESENPVFLLDGSPVYDFVDYYPWFYPYYRRYGGWNTGYRYRPSYARNHYYKHRIPHRLPIKHSIPHSMPAKHSIPHSMPAKHSIPHSMPKPHFKKH